MARSSVSSRIELAAAFAHVLHHYWLGVFPRARTEIRRWRERAGLITDPALRAVALEAQHSKSGNLECAAVFAVFAPSKHRVAVTQTLVAFQAIYDYVDLLAEQPTGDPIANGHQLHQALLAIVDPDLAPGDYYAHSRHWRDGGYLQEMVLSCQSGLVALPSFAAVRSTLKVLVGRMIMFQSFNHGDINGSHDRFIQWADDETPADGPLHWWEIAAAAGSSLPVLALIAAASDPQLSRQSVAAIEDIYYPWIASLNTLLDSLVDQQEDSTPGQNALLAYYPSSNQGAQRIHTIAERATRGARTLPHGSRHAVILAAMIAYYLSNPDAQSTQAQAATALVMTAMGDLQRPTMLIFRLRRLAERVTDAYGARPADRPDSAATQRRAPRPAGG
ncbi:MAG TPA: DUF2600 family protein [Solirubrobacteraceae bacterium]